MSRRNRDRRRSRASGAGDRDPREHWSRSLSAALGRAAEPADIDGAALDGLVAGVEFARGLDGRWVYVVSPRDPGVHHMDFDRGVCAAGLRCFVRPRLPSDWPITGEWVMVAEEAPGQRLRFAVDLEGGPAGAVLSREG